MREEELIIYKEFADGDILRDVVWLMEHYRAGDGRARPLFYRCMHRLSEQAADHGFYGNLWHCYLTNLLVNNENSYSCACEMRGEVEGSINELVLHDIAIFKEFFDYDFTEMMVVLKAPEFAVVLNYEGPSADSKIYNRRIRDRICTLAQHFVENENAAAMKATLTQFYREYGVGDLGLHKAFRVEHTETGAQIVPIRNIAHVYLDDLVGYEIPKQKLCENTEAFVAGRRANNCLLFGDAGTGKSSCVKAIANEYYEKGLRIIELYKHQFQDLNKYLKALIEGGLEKKPANVLIYATSNRRHLIRENYSDKADRRDEDMHAGDTVQEKLSLVYRFGVTIFFGSPDKKQFQQIVKTLAERNGLKVPEEELFLLANKWELSHGGLSGRTAQQFIDFLLGQTAG